MLTVSRLHKSFPGVKALDAIDLEVRPGEVHALVGENGAGKSTLVKILGGGLLPDAGEVLFGGVPLPYGDPLRVRRSGIGVIYQEFTLVPELSAAANIFLGSERTRRGFLCGLAMTRAAREVLGQLGCDFDPHTRVRDLGVGLRQLVEVARSLAAGSRCLIFDEPSATLTESELERLFVTIRGLRDRNFAVIYISHRLEEIFAISDRVTVLRDGRHVRTAATRDVSRDELIHWMVGRELRKVKPTPHPGGDRLLEVRGLGCPPFFERVSFDLFAGEILGFAGLVGAGRTSVGLSLFGRRPPIRGEVRLDGNPAHFRHPWESLAAGVGYLTEDRQGFGIFGDLSVAENITIAHLDEYRRGPFLSETLRQKAARDACERFDVRTAGMDRAMRTLSGGNQQKALLARFLSRPLRVLILDEPTRGVDVGAREEVYEIIRSLTRSRVGVVLISSDLPELLAICDRIVVLREGHDMGVLARGEATQESIMDLATKEVGE